MAALLSRLARCRRGVTAVEFALTLPFMMVMLVGLAEFGLAVNEKMRLESAAWAGVQYGYSHTTDTAGMVSAVQQGAGLDPSKITVATAFSWGCADGSTVAQDATCGDGSQKRSYVTVTVTETWRLTFQFPGFPTSLPLTAAATLRFN
ncbi:MAG: TadE/TadG family type IV pilus assembly protein [Actinomycetota bacterium]